MKISIVTATFNSGRTLRDTMESVLRQSYADWEHIIIDGGSKDDTLAIVREMEPRYGGRLRWVSEPDHGIYDAMNKGIALASGDVVGLLNSDDFFTADDALLRVVEAFYAHDIDAMYGDVHYVDDSDLTRCVRYYSSAGFCLWKMRLGFMPAHPSFYCRREVYERLGAFDLDFHVAADFECLLRFVFVNRIATHYVSYDFVTMRTGGASTSGINSHRKIWRDHRRAYKKNGVYSNFVLEAMRYFVKAFDLLPHSRYSLRLVKSTEKE